MTADDTPGPFAGRLTRAPLADDPAAGAEAWARLEGAVAGDLRALVEGAAGSAPFLADALAAEADWAADALSGPPEAAMASLLEEVRAAAEAELGERGRLLRRAKRRAALLIALADLGGVWTLEEVTGALSDLADDALAAALRAPLAEEIAKGRLPGDEADPIASTGLVAFAMGKGGARELNYSSDIDLILLFDESGLGEEERGEVRARLVSVCRGATQLLSKPTAHGYVFRVDLRLRPDPSVTPIVLSMAAAERYYESLGRTWERAAWIKARPAVGDLAAGEAFLERMRPFVWRRHLDFAAIRDAHDIRERIRAHRGGGGPIEAPGHDVKLGRGGIREIEFFVQTRQLITGGRDPGLRLRATRPALAALTKAGWVPEDVADSLDAAYLAHRELEHRLQMIEDRQTHAMPTAPEARDRVAALAGRGDREAFEADLVERLTAVAAVAERFFTPGGRPDTAEAEAPSLEVRGFRRPEAAEERLARWRAGEIPATRAERARAMLGGLEPLILEALSHAASPDDALAEFDRFLSGLPAGVQILSLFEANPRLLDLVAEICAAAPRLAAHLGRRPAVVDAILATDFFEPLPEPDALEADLRDWMAREDDYERKLDAARRWAREMRFRVGVQVLRGLADARQAGRDFAGVAEACLRALLPEVEAEVARRYGPPPGRGAAVLALGKMGGREMTSTSDLDLILLYDAAGEEASAGPKPLAPPAYFARFTQALVGALSAQTAEGQLYAIDMRLRPSGRQGTVATSLGGFRSYQREQAWTWERLALTRARAVAGRADLRADADAAVAEALRLPAEPDALRRDVARMRSRVAEANLAARDDPWELKHARGGLMDVEFVAQLGALQSAAAGETGVPLGGAAAPALLVALREAGRLDAGEAELLSEAHALQTRIQQVARVAHEGPFRPEQAGPGFLAALCRATGCETLDDLSARLVAAQSAAAEIVEARLGPSEAAA